MTSFELRKKFLHFFNSHGHKTVPSASLVPTHDPTLIFSNAGMNQFKNIFLGHTQPEHARVISVQKCVRAGGKHNDLDNVGFTARHHTFFEMLGNFSFGDYFKAEALDYAWQFVTRELGLPKDRLYISIFKEDDESLKLWQKVTGISKDRIYAFGEDDNFWRMGSVGPCGPCSEIFFDLFPDRQGEPMRELGDRCIEIWNLVFMQFNESSEGRSPLPRPCVDTGMGLERITAVLQGKKNNYHSDIFRPLIEEAQKQSGQKFDWDLDVLATAGSSCDPEDHSFKKQNNLNAAFCVLADHVRACSFLIADGVLPSNDGRGYVLRRILRRATRFEREAFGGKKCFQSMAQVLLEQMKGLYPELEQNKSVIFNTLQSEQQRFLKTLESGSMLLEKALHQVKQKDLKQLDADSVFKLYDTYGFPPDLTQLICKEQGIEADLQGFKKIQASKRQKESFVKATKRPAVFNFSIDQNLKSQNKKQEFKGYRHLSLLPKIQESQNFDVLSYIQKLEDKIINTKDTGLKNKNLQTLQQLKINYTQSLQKTSLEVSASHSRVLSMQTMPEQQQKTTGSGGSFIHEQSMEEKQLSSGAEAYVVVGPDVCFYAEGGGQVGDRGWLVGLEAGYREPYVENKKSEVNDEVTSGWPFPSFYEYKSCVTEVLDCKKYGDFHVLRVKVIEGSLTWGQEVVQQVDMQRRLNTAKNHSATHLMHAALRKVLGSHVTQAGSLVAPDRLRFDFTHSKPVSPSELRQVEDMVNDEIVHNYKVEVKENVKFKNATAQVTDGGEGALALFGEKYGDQVRVLKMGKDFFSTELCGGTHVESTGVIGAFVITSETGIGSGVRRVEALTGARALNFLQHHRFENEPLRKVMGLPTLQPPSTKKVPMATDDVLSATLQQYEKLKSKLAQLEDQNTQNLVQWKLKSLNPAACQKIQYKSAGVLLLLTDVSQPKLLQAMAEKLENMVADNKARQQLPSIFESCPKVLVVVGQGDKRHPVVVRSQDKAVSARDVLVFVGQHLGGKGGGKANIAQGVVEKNQTHDLKALIR